MHDEQRTVTFTFITYQRLDIRISNLLFHDEPQMPSDCLMILALLSFSLVKKRSAAKSGRLKPMYMVWIQD